MNKGYLIEEIVRMSKAINHGVDIDELVKMHESSLKVYYRELKETYVNFLDAIGGMLA